LLDDKELIVDKVVLIDATNAQSLYNLAMYFVQKVPRTDEPDPHYAKGMEIIKEECKKIIDILGQGMQWNIMQLMDIYLPMSTGVAEEDKPYLDWMDALIRDLLAARPMWRPVYKRAQTSGQILATTYSGFYNAPTNKEINGIIDLSMAMDVMDRVIRPWDNTDTQTKQCFNSEIGNTDIVVHISCTADDSTVDFTRDKKEEQNLFNFVWNMCSAGTDKKRKKIDVIWISGKNCTSLARRLIKPRTKMWNFQWVIFSSGYIPTEEWEQLTQIFYSHYYGDSKRDVVQAYKSTLSHGISDNATNNLQLFGKNMDNEIIPPRLRLAEKLTDSKSKKRKEKSSETNDRLMSVQKKAPELKDSDWSKRSKEELSKPSKMALSQRMTTPMRWATLRNRSLGMGKLPTPNVLPKSDPTWSLIPNSMETACMEQ
jgi:hypothetical protein